MVMPSANTLKIAAYRGHRRPPRHIGNELDGPGVRLANSRAAPKRRRQLGRAGATTPAGDRGSEGNQRADKSYDSDTGCEVAALAQITHATVTGGDANSSRIVGRGLGSSNGANEQQSGHQP